MEKKLDELYNKLVNYILDMIPESAEWEDVYYLGEVEKGKLSWSSVFYFKDTEKNIILKSHKIPERYHVSQEVYYKLLQDLNDVLLEVYDCFVENEQEPWEQISLYFNTEGKFKVDFFYDVISAPEALDHPTREIVWAYHTFGYISESSYWRGVLEEYLKGQSDKEK